MEDGTSLKSDEPKRVQIEGEKEYLDIEEMYNTWEYTNFGGGKSLKAGHPQLVGAEAALWNDIKLGASEFDIFNRFRDQIMLMAEKGWYDDRNGGSSEEFIQRVEAVGKVTPKANPARYIESDTALVAAYDFEQAENNVVTDALQNIF